MSAFPSIENLSSSATYGTTNASVPLLVTYPSTGAWIELDPSIPDPISFIYFQCYQISGSGTEIYEIDIGVGASGAETVVVEKLAATKKSFSRRNAEATYSVPVDVAAGERLSIRITKVFPDTTQQTMGIRMQTFTNSVRTSQTVELIGSVDIDPGAVANTKSAWVEVAASATADYYGAFAAMTFKGSGAINSDGAGFLDIGSGAASSETAQLSNLWLDISNGRDSFYPIQTPLLPLSFSTGDRITARFQSTITAAAERTLTLYLYGITPVYAPVVVNPETSVTQLLADTAVQASFPPIRVSQFVVEALIKPATTAPPNLPASQRLSLALGIMT